MARLGLVAGCLLIGLGAVIAAEDITTDPMSELTWLVGGWRGEQFGGVCEETWGPAAGGQMMGTFRLTNDDGVAFYEFMTIARRDEGFALRLKHFNADLTGWEAKDEFIEFPPKRFGPGLVAFDGISYRQLGSDSLVITLDDKQTDSTHERVEFRMGRISTDHK